jgi:hypothetical protein
MPNSAKKPTDLIGLGDARLHKTLARAVQSQHSLVFDALQRHKPHPRPSNSVTDRFRVRRVDFC